MTGSVVSTVVVVVGDHASAIAVVVVVVGAQYWRQNNVSSSDGSQGGSILDDDDDRDLRDWGSDDVWVPCVQIKLHQVDVRITNLPIRTENVRFVGVWHDSSTNH